MNTNSGPQRIVAKWPAQLYGQFEVSAKVSVHPAVVTSIDVSQLLAAVTSIRSHTKHSSSSSSMRRALICVSLPRGHVTCHALHIFLKATTVTLTGKHVPFIFLADPGGWHISCSSQGPQQ
jgi:hypothetical protein